MLPRVLEPEVMASPQEAQEYDSMDHSHVNQIFVDDLVQAGFVEGDVLDLGTGTAQIPIQIVRRLPHCRIMAVDLSIEMLELARLNLEVASATERVQLGHVDAKHLPYPDHQFDAVISNSIVHHLAEPRGCLSEAIRVTRPGGWLFFRDLIRPDTESQLEQLVCRYTGQETLEAQELYRHSLQAALTVEEVRALILSLGFEPQTVQATSDRHWTWAARKPTEGKGNPS